MGLKRQAEVNEFHQVWKCICLLAYLKCRCRVMSLMREFNIIGIINLYTSVFFLAWFPIMQGIRRKYLNILGRSRGGGNVKSYILVTWTLWGVRHAFFSFTYFSVNYGVEYPPPPKYVGIHTWSPLMMSQGVWVSLALSSNIPSQSHLSLG